MSKLTAEKCRTLIGRLSEDQRASRISIFGELYLQALEIALPVLERPESDGDVFIVMRNPGKVPDIKRPVGDVSDYLLHLYQHNPEAICDVVTYRFAGVSGQWVQDGRELLAMLEVNQPSSTPQIDNDGYIEWKSGECPVGKSEVVNVRYRDGEEDTGIAGFQSWKHVQESDDIIAYRVIEKDGREG